MEDGKDRRTGVTIFSLYSSATKKPTAEQLEGLDALVFDIQDIGCRFYTYISTMGNCMEAASEAGIKFVVLDRVNPIGGLVVDGPVRDGESSFTAYHDIPVRHGMTVGELAKLFKAERFPELELEVVPVEGWRRGVLFGETGLPWVNPSPNIRNLNQAMIYPGVGLLEFTNLSVGRGTSGPFELLGAPYINGDDLARELRGAKLAGLGFVPVKFTPDASKFEGEECGGVRVLVTDREGCDSVGLGIELGRILERLYPEDWETGKLNTLLAHPATREAILGNRPMGEIREMWEPELLAFSRRRQVQLIYKE